MPIVVGPAPTGFGVPSGPGNQPGPAKPNRVPLYIGLGVIAVLAVVSGMIAFGGSDDDDANVRDSDTTISNVSTSVVETTSPETVPATEPTVIDTGPGVVLPTIVTTVTTVPDTVPGTEPAATTVAPDGLVDVADSTGAFVVRLPATYETNVDPASVGGVLMSHVTGATDIEQYLTGDFSVQGATVLIGPAAEVGTPSDLLANFDPGDACTLANTEEALPTGAGDAKVLSYDQCGGGDFTMILIAIDLPDDDRILFVGMQGVGPANGPARDEVLAILDSVQRT
jgi:hypothetical protein